MGNFTGKEEEANVANGSIGQIPPLQPGGTVDLAARAPMDFDSVAGNAEEEIVPTVFKWEHGGRQVFITGTFNNWAELIPMHREGNDWTHIHNLVKGKHAFKFVVDDEWRFAPDLPTVVDIEGRINNFIDVSTFEPYTGDENYLETAAKEGESDEVYTRVMPGLDEYTKEPMALPPHLRHLILNRVPRSNDPAALSTPLHVSVNHLNCTAAKDGMLALGLTERFDQKYTTTIFYAADEGS
mmetsp:Transcript_41984/g.82584  ORF Transcript_41984/g.82584 Transcript_41984/m.82584 type:complete len:240 (+) Transcript_41984:131-850(+)|eukprot:CAMPEP_0171624108 /NCGR_PEP_ID=MMETSP0990-20121206/18396_1 /TAXON_ID=483369 /ORGANISM="non described non described, Strain CCMP2098" /LENGTH=239 /DNA_ID=CAMNT_0012190541 /DNA_START=103 /DNA_END=822 /DNA_ORIENTATION=-